MINQIANSKYLANVKTLGGLKTVEIYVPENEKTNETINELKEMFKDKNVRLFKFTIIHKTNTFNISDEYSHRTYNWFYNTFNNEISSQFYSSLI